MTKVLKRNTFKFFISIILVAALAVTPIINVSAAPNHSLTFKMTNGGKWEYNGKTDTSVTSKWTNADWHSATVVNKVVYLTPSNVKSNLYKTAKDVGASETLSGIKYGVEMAASYGITVAKQKLINKFGSSVASKFVPILSYFSWTYTAVDILQAIATGKKLSLLADAASKNKGLIYVNQRNKGDASTWYYWDGSSSYGSYPNAKLGPNNWQYGKVTVY